MNRGAAKQFVYFEDQQRDIFLSLLREVHLRYKVEIHAYCLMGNHYHLLIRTHLPNLSHVMRHLDGVYTQRFNKLMKRDGPLFRGRYKACLIESENYLTYVSKYIHLNPVVASITKNPEEYLWSSYRCYVNLATPPDWLTTDTILQFFNGEDIHNKFAAFTKNKNYDNEFVDKIRKKAILGSDSFIKLINEKFILQVHRTSEIPMHKDLLSKPSLFHIHQIVGNFFKIPLTELLNSKPGKMSFPRAILIYLSVLLTQEKNKDIGKYFGNISASAVSHAYHKIHSVVNSDQYIQNTVSALQRLIYSQFRT